MIFIFKIFQIGCKLRMLIIGVTFGAIFRENRKCNEKKVWTKKLPLNESYMLESTSDQNL